MASRASSKRAGPLKFKSVIKDTDRGYRDLMKRIEACKRAAILVGITQGTGAASHEGTGRSVLDIAMIHEFGLGVPERSFIRGWFDAFQPTASKQIAALMASVVSGKRTLSQVLELLGVRFVGECQRYMINGPFQALSPITIRRKGSSKPLIDTGQMKSSVTYRIALGGLQSKDRMESAPVAKKKTPLSKTAKKAAKRAASFAKRGAARLTKRAARGIGRAVVGKSRYGS